MPTQPELTPAPPLNPLEGWFGHHPTAALGLAVLSLLMSLILVTRMCFCHRKASFLKKLAWTFILLVPLAGWIAYGGLFHPLSYSDTPGFASDWYSNS